MEIRKEINDFYALADMVWSGAVDTITDIQNANKGDEFMNFLEAVFCDEVPTDTEVNDFIWFERDYIYESLGLTENGELPEEEPEEEMAETLNESINRLIVSDDFDEFCDDCGQVIVRERASKFTKNYHDYRCGKCGGKFKFDAEKSNYQILTASPKYSYVENR